MSRRTVEDSDPRLEEVDSSSLFVSSTPPVTFEKEAWLITSGGPMKGRVLGMETNVQSRDFCDTKSSRWRPRSSSVGEGTSKFVPKPSYEDLEKRLQNFECLRERLT